MKILEQLQLLKSKNTNYEVLIPLMKYVLNKNDEYDSMTKIDPPTNWKRSLKSTHDPKGRFDPPTEEVRGSLVEEEEKSRIERDNYKTNIFDKVKNKMFHGPKTQKEAKVINELLGEAAKGDISW